ncbi:MAG: hypothetical protein PHX21_05820 [bacterium]|nr:hypothetical protein [bacterium]
MSVKIVFLGATLTDTAWSARADNLQKVMRLIDSNNIQNLTTQEARKTIERAVFDIQGYIDFLNSVIRQRYTQINYPKETEVFEAVISELESLERVLSDCFISGGGGKFRNKIVKRYFTDKTLNRLVANIPESLGRMDKVIRKTEIAWAKETMEDK